MNKILDKNGRLFGRISLIDVGVVAVVAVLALALFVRQNATPTVSPVAPMDDIRYEVTITNMPQGRLDSIRVGDYLYDGDNKTGSPVGTIVDIQVSECTIPSQKADGTYVMGTVDERTNVVLVLEAKGIVDSRGRTYINRTNEVAVGSLINYYTFACQFSGTITELG